MFFKKICLVSVGLLSCFIAQNHLVCDIVEKFNIKIQQYKYILTQRQFRAGNGGHAVFRTDIYSNVTNS